MALPAIMLAIPGGHLADRFDRRRVLATMLFSSAVVAATLGLGCSCRVSAAWIYVLLVCNGVGLAIAAPSRTALLPWIVPSQQFASAVTWNSTAFHIALMVGPVVGGLLVSYSAGQGVPVALSAVVLFRLASVAAILMVRASPPERRQASISLEVLGAGIRFVWSQKPILATISLDLFAVLLGGVTFVLPAFAHEVLKYPNDQIGAVVGYLRSAEAVGAISMALLLAHLPPIRRAGWTILWAVAGYGAVTIFLGLTRYLWMALGAMFLIGALDNISVVVRQTLVQLLTPDGMRGRVTAVCNVFIVASNELGGVESGVAARLLGLVPSIIFGGAGAICAVLACVTIWPQILAIGSLVGLRPAGKADAGRQLGDSQDDTTLCSMEHPLSNTDME